MSDYNELKRQIEISTPPVIAETKRIYRETTDKAMRQFGSNTDGYPEWTEAVESLPNTDKILGLNIMVVEVMIDVIKKARWNCWINGKLIL
jgi:hypothetical protein